MSSTKGELTRQAILVAAIPRFGREGYRATSVADVARDAAVGGSVPYRYFADKEALFLAAIDEDAAAVIQEALAVLDDATRADWRQTLFATLLVAVEQHPLARRLLAGLEPEVTARVLEIPALAELRKACAERLGADQLRGAVRSDIDPLTMANGIAAILLSLLMSVVQVGPEVVGPYADDVTALFEAAIDRSPPVGG